MGTSEEAKRKARLMAEINAYKRALAEVKNSTLRIWIESQIESREIMLALNDPFRIR